MGSGKRASMREGPLAALFRKTETEGLEPPKGEQPASEPELPPRATPTPQERLRNAFSSDVPGDMLAAPDEPPSREVPPPNAADYQWGASRDVRVTRGSPTGSRKPPRAAPSERAGRPASL